MVEREQLKAPAGFMLACCGAKAYRTAEMGNGKWEMGQFPISHFPFPQSYSVDLYSSRFGVPLGFPVITPEVELLMIQVRIVDDE
jgi:hypothetical protein